jgi:hypothetical protein
MNYDKLLHNIHPNNMKKNIVYKGKEKLSYTSFTINRGKFKKEIELLTKC